MTTGVKMRVVDGDGHYHEPANGLADYIDPKYRDWAPRTERDAEGNEKPAGKGWGSYNPTFQISRLVPTGRAGQFTKWGDGRGEVEHRNPDRPHAVFDEFQRSLTRDPHMRLRILDEEGVDASVLYPTAALMWIPEPDYHMALNAALNNWLADYCSADPTRLHGAANIVAIHDVERACDEARRCVQELGFKSIFIRSCTAAPETRWWDRSYDPFWATCQDLDVAVGVHPFPGDTMYGSARYFDLIGPSTEQLFMSTAVNNMIDAQHMLATMLIGGVPERFPNLRIGILEASGGWLVPLLERLDHRYEHLGHVLPDLTMKPSDYFRRQIWISFDPDEFPLAMTAQWIGADRIIWGSDFPHPDAFYPGFVDMLNSSMAGLSPDEQERIRGLNAIDFYKLPDER